MWRYWYLPSSPSEAEKFVRRIVYVGDDYDNMKPYEVMYIEPGDPEGRIYCCKSFHSMAIERFTPREVHKRG